MSAREDSLATAVPQEPSARPLPSELVGDAAVAHGGKINKERYQGRLGVPGSLPSTEY